jgi:flagellar basal-body rod modification protein FlgD
MLIDAGDRQRHRHQLVRVDGLQRHAVAERRHKSFTWNGQGNNGQTWPDGTYTLSIKATGANGQATTVSTQVQGEVSGVNLTSNPPTLNVNGQNVQISQVTSISK